jgi:hypothetical protein
MLQQLHALDLRVMTQEQRDPAALSNVGGSHGQNKQAREVCTRGLTRAGSSTARQGMSESQEPWLLIHMLDCILSA